MLCLTNLCSEELILLANGVSCYLAKDSTIDDLVIESRFFSLLAVMLGTIATERSICAQRQLEAEQAVQDNASSTNEIDLSNEKVKEKYIQIKTMFEESVFGESAPR